MLDKSNHSWHSIDMENESPSTAPQKKSNMMPIALVVALVVIILVGVIAFAMNKKPDAMQQTAGEQSAQPTQGKAMTAEPTVGEAMTASAYKDGTYEAEGEYTSPGGAESIDVSLTLKDGKVTDATVESNATRPISKQMQASFISGYKEQVIGKSLDEINLTKVAASSLAPKGFNDAVEKIKSEAKA